MSDPTTYEQLQTLLKDMRSKVEGYGDKLKDVTDPVDKSTIDNLQSEIDKRMDELRQEMAEAKAPQTTGTGAQEGKSDPETLDAFWTWVKEGRAALSDEQRALVENTEGQILVPEDVDAEIQRRVPENTVIRGLASVRTTTSDRVRRAALDSVQVSWGKLETGTSINESELNPSETYIYIQDQHGLVKVGMDELEDAEANLPQIIQEEFSIAALEEEDDRFIDGGGNSSNEPEGILNATSNSSPFKPNEYPTDSSGTLDADDMLKIPYELDAKFRGGGVYIVASNTERDLRLLKDSNNQYLWQPALMEGTPAVFGGYPIFTQDAMPAVSASNKAVIFGDLRRGYRIVDRRGMRMQRLNEKYIEEGLIGFMVTRRLSGAVTRGAALCVATIAS